MLSRIGAQTKAINWAAPSGSRCLETRHAVCQRFVLAAAQTNIQLRSYLSLTVTSRSEVLNWSTYDILYCVRHQDIHKTQL